MGQEGGQSQMQKVQQAPITTSMEGLFAEEPVLQGAQLGGPVKQGVVGRRQAPEQRLEESFQSKLLGLAAEKAGGFSQRLKWQSRKQGLHY